MFHTPWLPRDVNNTAKRFPDPREHFEEACDELMTIHVCYNPNVNYLLQLLHIYLPGELRNGVLMILILPSMPKRSTLLKLLEPIVQNKVSWDKINACRQKKDEPPADYKKRLMKAMTVHSGIKNPAETATGAKANAFVPGLWPKISQQLRTVCIAWRSMDPKGLVDAAEHCSNCQEWEKEHKLRD